MICSPKKSYVAFNLHPKKVEDYNLVSTNILKDKFGIVITGKIDDIDFLTETLKFYNKIFPDAALIVSTWKDLDNASIARIKAQNANLILNELPGVYAPLTLTYQMKTAHEGIKFAKEIGCKYILKTRVDWRLYKPNSLAFLLGTLNSFPVREGTKAKGRLIVTSMTTFKYRTYGLTDTLLFGHIDDLSRYFFYDENDEYFFANEEDIEVTIKDDVPVVTEIYLCSRYLENIGVTLDWTLDDWWLCLKDYFCVVDSYSLDIFWPKYTYENNNRINRHYSKKASRTVEFSDWLALYSGLEMQWQDLNYKEKWSYENKVLKRDTIF